MEQTLKSQKEEISKIGVFNLIKKAEIKRNIEIGTQKLENLKNEIEEKENEKNLLKQNLETECEETIKEYKRNIYHKYQLPLKPKELLDYLEQTRSGLNRDGSEYEKFKNIIIGAIADLSEPVSAWDLQKYSGEFRTISNQKLSSFLNILVAENELEKIKKDKVTYFALKD